MLWFCIFLILIYNYFLEEKKNYSLGFIGIVIIILLVDNYINLLNRNLEVF